MADAFLHFVFYFINITLCSALLIVTAYLFPETPYLKGTPPAPAHPGPGKSPPSRRTAWSVWWATMQTT